MYFRLNEYATFGIGTTQGHVVSYVWTAYSSIRSEAKFASPSPIIEWFWIWRHFMWSKHQPLLCDLAGAFPVKQKQLGATLQLCRLVLGVACVCSLVHAGLEVAPAHCDLQVDIRKCPLNCCLKIVCWKSSSRCYMLIPDLRPSCASQDDHSEIHTMFLRVDPTLAITNIRSMCFSAHNL